MAWSFDGVSDYVTIADNAALDLPSGDWTIAGWFKLASTADTGDDAYFFQHGASASTSIRFALYSSGGSTMDAVYARFTGSVFVPDADAPNWTPNTNWNQIRIERDGNNCRIYMNGSQIASEDITGLGGIAPSGTFYFSRDPGGSTDWFPGLMAEWAKWDRVLTTAEAEALTKGFAPTFFRNSLGWYVPMMREYVELKNGLSITNNGTAIGDHPNIIYPTRPYIIQAPVSAGETFNFAGSQTVSFDGTAALVQTATFTDSQAVSFDGTAAMIQTAALTGAETVSFDGTADTIRNQWAFTDSQTVSFDGTAALVQSAALTGAETVSFDGTAALKQSAALTGGETVSFDGTAALDIAAIAFAGQGVLSFDGSIATVNAILQMEAAQSVSFDGQAALGQEALFEGGATLSFDGLANLLVFEWEDAESATEIIWSDID